MNTPRPGTAGATRVCPHCKATVLESAAVCPGCRHHLKFNTGGAQDVVSEGYSALSIDGTIAPKETGGPCEYCVVLDIRDERGQQVMRQVLSVGVLRFGEARHVNVSVEMLPVRTQVAAKTQASVNPSSPTHSPLPPLKPPGLPTSSPLPPLKPPGLPSSSLPPLKPPGLPSSSLPPLRPPGLPNSSPLAPLKTPTSPVPAPPAGAAQGLRNPR
jgi:hypothetical protein